MFTGIGWQGYWVTIALLTAGYYLLIYLRYFRKDFRVEGHKNESSNKENSFPSAMPGVAIANFDTAPQPPVEANSDAFQFPATGTSEHAVYACMDEISAYLEEAKRTKCVKEELLFALHAILRKYPAIATSTYKESLTCVIVNQCAYHCSVHLCADDVVRVWEEG